MRTLADTRHGETTRLETKGGVMGFSGVSMFSSLLAAVAAQQAVIPLGRAEHIGKSITPVEAAG